MPSTIYFSILNPDSGRLGVRLRAQKSSMNYDELLTLQCDLNKRFGVRGRIQGHYMDGRYRLQYYSTDAYILALSFGFFCTRMGAIYGNLRKNSALYTDNWEEAEELIYDDPSPNL